MTMPALAFVLLLFAGLPPRPAPGEYVFVKPFELKGCAEYDGSRGVVATCLKEEKKAFAVGDTVQVGEFFWDDHRNAWTAAYEFLKTRMPIPLTHLKPGPKARTPAR